MMNFSEIYILLKIEHISIIKLIKVDFKVHFLLEINRQSSVCLNNYELV